MVCGTEGARLLTLRLAHLKDRGERARGAASMAKMTASDVALAVGDGRVPDPRRLRRLGRVSGRPLPPRREGVPDRRGQQPAAQGARRRIRARPSLTPRRASERRLGRPAGRASAPTGARRPRTPRGPAGGGGAGRAASRRSRAVRPPRPAPPPPPSPARTPPGPRAASSRARRRRTTARAARAARRARPGSPPWPASAAASADGSSAASARWPSARSSAAARASAPDVHSSSRGRGGAGAIRTCSSGSHSFCGRFAGTRQCSPSKRNGRGVKARRSRSTASPNRSPDPGDGRTTRIKRPPRARSVTAASSAISSG